MLINITSSVCFFIVMLILIIDFFSKKTLNNLDNNSFKHLSIVSLFGLTIEFLCYLLVIFNVDIFSPIMLLFGRIIYVYYIIFMYYFILYVYSTCKEIQKETDMYILFKKILSVIYIVFLLIILILPFSFAKSTKYLYPIGLATDFSYFIGALGVFFIIVICILNFRILKQQKSTPILWGIIGAVISMIIQFYFHELLLLIPAHAIAIIIMYFTMENPDMKMLEELHKSKEISDNANEEKTLFLYNMTQEIRGITNDINYDADIILDSKDWEETYDSARDIKATTSKFNSITNEILDVSNIDSSTIKVYNSKYNLKNLLKQMVNVYGDLCNNKMLKFITNIDHDIPEELYGDLINLKEVLNTILSNSVKYTNKGFVELSVNTIIKNDICRLIITVEDSGVGIKSEDINKIKLDNKSLAKANNLITVMHGAMMISSNYGVGTKVKVILDQKIETQDNTEIAKYESTFDDVNIICVDDSEAGLKIIDKLLKGTNIKIDFVNTGKECLNSLRVNKYDLVLLDEELEQETGIELMQKIKEIRNFRTPVIFLTKDNSYEYNEEYAKAGFADYILKPIKKQQLMEKIDKYTK